MQTFFDNVTYGTTKAPNAPIATDYVDARVLGAGASEAHPIPSGAQMVNFSADGDFFAKFGTSIVTAAVPGADVANGSASMLNPGTRRIPAGATHIALIASAARVVTLEFWG
ncbi:hypothetical protein ABEG18_12940 [Alsobacter sp. KACC 23698]|uniref:Uncharacterized protein n=1 Tax=Alsobacter sp. KACC 23698 TaxID=3149229 RepID=A0AAU7JN06_9HYPH